MQPSSVTHRVAMDSDSLVDSGPSADNNMAAPPPSTSLTALPYSSSSLFPTVPSTGSGNKPAFTVPDFSSTQPPRQSAILSGLKFTAPPFSMKPVDHMGEEQERNRSPPSDSRQGLTLTGSDAVLPTFSSHARKNLGVSCLKHTHVSY